MKPLITIAVFTCLPFAVHAGSTDDGLSRQFTTCMDAAGGVTMDMIECIFDEAKRQDDRLNQAYQALRAGLSPERRKQLQQAQRAWIKFRDANCEFYYDPDGGTLARVAANQCVMRMTASRAAELQGLVQASRL